MHFAASLITVFTSLLKHDVISALHIHTYLHTRVYIYLYHVIHGVIMYGGIVHIYRQRDIHTIHGMDVTRGACIRI